MNFKITRKLTREQGSTKQWTIFADGVAVGEMKHSRDWVKANQTDRIRSKMANVSDLSWETKALSELTGKIVKRRTRYENLNRGADALISDSYGMRGFVSFKAAKEELAELFAKLEIEA